MECQTHRAALAPKLCCSLYRVTVVSLTHGEILNSSHFIYNLYKAVKLRTRCLGMCVYIRVCFALYIQSATCCDLCFLVSKYFFSIIIFIPLSVCLLLSLNQFACEPTFRTNCMYFFPGARIDNWIRGSITMAVFDKRNTVGMGG